MKELFKRILFILLYVIIFFFLNFIAESIFIPDTCYYHMNDGNYFFNLFYDTPSWNGGHPYPSNFNFLFTIFLGIFFGVILSKR